MQTYSGNGRTFNHDSTSLCDNHSKTSGSRFCLTVAGPAILPAVPCAAYSKLADLHQSSTVENMVPKMHFLMFAKQQGHMLRWKAGCKKTYIQDPHKLLPPWNQVTHGPSCKQKAGYHRTVLTSLFPEACAGQRLWGFSQLCV